jgi:tetratricopeptide (TPR) repeat protein
LELMGSRRPHRDKLYLRDNEVMPYVLKRKEQGNQFYKNGEFLKAVHEYKACTKAISFIHTDDYKAPLIPVMLQLLGNLAAAHLALGNWKRVIKYCTLIVNQDASNEKAYFRRAQALRKYPERLEEARKDLQEAIRLAPSNKQLRIEYDTLLDEVKQKRKVDKMAYGTIFKEQAAIYEARRPRVFFELAQGKTLLGRLEIELFSDRVPKSAENFRALCVGFPETSKRLHYQGSILHRVIEGYIVQVPFMILPSTLNELY